MEENGESFMSFTCFDTCFSALYICIYRG
jgi:hypothetical protein